MFRGTNIFYNNNISPVENNGQRREIAEKKASLCVIASSGMLTGGASSFYAGKFAGDEKNFIAITCYQDEESPGRRILDMRNMIKSVMSLATIDVYVFLVNTIY